MWVPESVKNQSSTIGPPLPEVLFHVGIKVASSHVDIASKHFKDILVLQSEGRRKLAHFRRQKKKRTD